MVAGDSDEGGYHLATATDVLRDFLFGALKLQLVLAELERVRHEKLADSQKVMIFLRFAASG